MQRAEAFAPLQCPVRLAAVVEVAFVVADAEHCALYDTHYYTMEWSEGESAHPGPSPQLDPHIGGQLREVHKGATDALPTPGARNAQHWRRGHG